MSKATLDYQRRRGLISEHATTYSSMQPKPSFETLAKTCLEALDIPLDSRNRR